MLIDIYTSRLEKEQADLSEANNHTDQYYLAGYYEALDDLRGLVNLEPTESSERD